jgi:hypothetical protein
VSRQYFGKSLRLSHGFKKYRAPDIMSVCPVFSYVLAVIVKVMKGVFPENQGWNESPALD